MTDLDAILRAVVAEPADDTPRLVYAEMCDDLAGVVACPRCGGSGKHDLNPYELAVRYGTHRAGLILVAARCVACDGSGSVSNGLAERAEFVRAQVELARLAVRPLAEVMLHPRPAASQMFGPGLVAGTLGGSPEGVVVGAVVDWTASTGLDRAAGYFTGVGVVESVGQDRHGLTVWLRPESNEGSRPERDAAREKRRELRRRERELWGEYSREWFGDSALWLPTDEPQRASPHVPGFVVRRGFVDEWRGPLSAFAGRVGLDLAAVFARHPIARVVLADREPTAASHQSGAWHWTWVGNDADSRVGLPRKLMAALSASGINGPFDTRDAAMDGLSLACVNLGRAAAGLDPLT